MDKIEKIVRKIIDAAEDVKAIGIDVLDVSEKTSIADRFIVVSGNSSNQVTAISDSIEKAMLDLVGENYGKEGYKEGRWIILDYNYVVVHIFHKDDREFYKLEELWQEK